MREKSRTNILLSIFVFVSMALWASMALAADVTLTPFVFTFNNPIGIDFRDTDNMLIMSVNYPFGTPNNLDLVNPTNGAHVPFSPLAGLDEELKIATVRTSTCQGGFTAGEVFTGNGNPGEVVRLSPAGVPTNPISPYTWATLTGEPALLRGSFFQDRFCVAGGDLIVVTGNAQTGVAANDNVGNVWRVTSAGVATKVATIGTHLEGVVTMPNISAVFGPAAGRILAGAEQFIVPGGEPTYDPNGGKIYAINPNATNDFFTISGAAPTTCIGSTGLPSGCNYNTANAFHPEDLDLIRRNSQFFGVAFSEGHVLTSPLVNGQSDFDKFCGQVLITQEFPAAGTSGLSALSWNGSSFVVRPITTNRDGTIAQWEHVTFTSGQDCNTEITIQKTPDDGVFTIGQPLTFTIVVTNTGNFDATNVTVTDPLPTNGLLTWPNTSSPSANLTTTQGTCSVSANSLTCNLGTILAKTAVTITVTSNAAPSTACQKQDNTATATSTSTIPASVSDDGHYTCTPPPQLAVDKTPDGAEFTQGSQVSFTIVVRNPAPAGAQSATNVQLTDTLPTNGGLAWATVTTTQGVCTLSGTNNSNLSCSLGTIAAQGSVTVVVKSTATTPADACQVQLNPAAVATAAGGLRAEDAGSVVCAPVAGPRITGGGSIFTVAGDTAPVGMRVTHGLQLHCDTKQKNPNLEINWAGGNNFHLDKITNVICSDDPKIQPPPPPNTVFDTYGGSGVFNGKSGYAVGTGTCNKKPATIYFILTDAGEPGIADTAEYHITGGCTLDVGPALLTKGNHQFHAK